MPDKVSYVTNTLIRLFVMVRTYQRAPNESSLGGIFGGGGVGKPQVVSPNISVMFDVFFDMIHLFDLSAYKTGFILVQCVRVF